ncbi:hypothetical protein W97_05620 [Coniosporium apollinis CBS 100218]|uniref:Cytochrome P450 n=1 Tax=Coniosporium apollinis (strain CBS 100218) TaxID=1168221 RepID=R7YWE3_CONA1|nr:uncharacterized protein W97_05620 [Coniosporium apollinis CBS 100218]EON66227.1 hypothetical protein W97_05620 [Coniosporium apollinis CBS 100218]
MGKYSDLCPRGAHPHLYGHFIQREYNLGPVFYLSSWPFGADMLVVQDPELAQQVTTQLFLPKHKSLKDIIYALSGENNMLTLEGAEWKRWRSIFNPGFSAANLMTLVPGIVDSAAVFADVLNRHAQKGDVFPLEEAATKVTVDIIGKVVLDHSFNSQETNNELVEAFLSQVRWTPALLPANPLDPLNPMRPFMQRYNKWRMDRYLNRLLDERFASRAGAQSRKPRKKTVIDLALQSYHDPSEGEERTKEDPSEESPQHMDPTFRSYALDQLKLFVFAGHDTTSSTICYALHLLSTHPSCLSAIRAEHDSVFGPDTSQTAELIKTSPHLLNALPYTLAVIREVLRLYPPASSVRRGLPGVYLHDPKSGEKYPTDGFLVWVHALGMHRSPDLWGPDAQAFKPERFLLENAASVPKDAWRPFEKGPRNCIGQELALLEARIILVMTVRRFDVRAAYETLGGGKEVKRETPEGLRKWVEEGLVYDVWADEAYQQLRATAKPAEGMPVRVMNRMNVLGSA